MVNVLFEKFGMAGITTVDEEMKILLNWSEKPDLPRSAGANQAGQRAFRLQATLDSSPRRVNCPLLK